MSMPIDMTEIFGTGKTGSTDMLWAAFMPMKLDPSLFDPARFDMMRFSLPMMGFGAGSSAGQPEPFAYGPFFGFSPVAMPAFDASAAAAMTAPALAMGQAYFAMSQAVMQAMMGLYVGGLEASRSASDRLTTADNPVEALQGAALASLEDARLRMAAAQEKISQAVEVFTATTAATAEEMREQVSGASGQVTSFVAAAATPVLFMTEDAPVEPPRPARARVAPVAATAGSAAPEGAAVAAGAVTAGGTASPVVMDDAAAGAGAAPAGAAASVSGVEGPAVASDATSADDVVSSMPVEVVTDGVTAGVAASPMVAEGPVAGTVAAPAADSGSMLAVEGPADAVSGTAAPMPANYEPTEADRPIGLEAARGTGPDDLKLISGVGPKIEGILHGLGIYHFDQIAGWSMREVAWVDRYLKFSGRIVRDEWVAQADALAAGGPDEYRRRFGKDPR